MTTEWMKRVQLQFRADGTGGRQVLQRSVDLVVLCWFVMCIVSGGAPRVSWAEEQRPNILLISIDDLNDWVGPLGGHPLVKTPNMERLAARGVTFTNAHCQSPLCNPSRTSVLTGLRPSTTGIYGLAPWVRTIPEYQDVVTLPEFFQRHGYQTLTVGKVYHDGYPPAAERAREFSVFGIPAPAVARPPQPFTETPAGHPAMDWGPYPATDEEHPDAKIADWAIEQLQNRPTEPFLLCIGFRLPHVPCYAPQKWFDLYPDNDSILPHVDLADRQDTPEFSWYLHWKLPEPRLSWLQSSGQWRPLVRAYLASTSFVDHQVGRVLDCLEAEGLANNTLVVLWSDHGWHLGEKGITGKNSLWERSTRVPLLIAGPRISAGKQCLSPVELLDIYPTLAALCDLDAPAHLEGHSLEQQLINPDRPREWPAITTHNQGNHAIRSERWRYIRYADGSEELYDMTSDPHEWRNIITDPQWAEIAAEHRRWIPVHDSEPAPGSAHRILVYNEDTGQSVWEGQPIEPASKEE